MKFWWYRRQRDRLRFWWWRTTDRVGYEAVDLFSHNIEWLLPRLRYMRDNAHSYPFVPVLNDDGSIAYGDDGQPLHAMTFDDWVDVIDEMIEGFECALGEDDWSDEAIAKQKRAAELLGKWFYALWM